MDYCNNLIEDIEVPFFENGVKKFGWHLTIKAAMQHQGWFHRRDRMPLKELSDTDYRAVASMMDTLPLNKYKNF
jgi:hypothetical protein